MTISETIDLLRSMVESGKANPDSPVVLYQDEMGEYYDVQPGGVMAVSRNEHCKTYGEFESGLGEISKKVLGSKYLNYVKKLFENNAVVMNGLPLSAE